MKEPNTNREKSVNSKIMLEGFDYLKKKYITEKEDFKKYIEITVKLMINERILEEDENWLVKMITEKEDSERLKKVLDDSRAIIKQLEKGDKILEDLGFS